MVGKPLEEAGRSPHGERAEAKTGPCSSKRGRACNSRVEISGEQRFCEFARKRVALILFLLLCTQATNEVVWRADELDCNKDSRHQGKGLASRCFAARLWELLGSTKSECRVGSDAHQSSTWASTKTFFFYKKLPPPPSLTSCYHCCLMCAGTNFTFPLLLRP